MPPRPRAREVGLALALTLTAAPSAAAAEPSAPPATPASAPPGAADPSAAPERDAAARDAAAREAQAFEEAHGAFREHDPVRAASCLTQLLELLRDPAYPRADHALSYAAGCAELAGQVGLSISLRRRLLDQSPSSPLARPALAVLARQHLDLTRYAEAAELMELYASRYADDRRTLDFLQDAAVLRHGLGQDDRALALLERAERRATGVPSRAAELFWSRKTLLPDTDAARQAHAEAYLKRYAAAGGRARRALALFTLAEITWRRSCKRSPRDPDPEGPWLGLCVSVRPGKAEGMCGPTTFWEVHPRDPKIADRARAFFREVVALASARPASSLEEWPREAREAVVSASITLTDGELEDYLRLLPDRDFLVGDTPAAKTSQKRFAEFMQTKYAGARRLRDRYSQIAAQDGRLLAVPLTARDAILSLHLSDSLQAVRTDLPNDKVRTEFCAVLRRETDEIESTGAQTLSSCLTRASVRGEFHGPARFCEAELQRRHPLVFPPLRELFAAAQVLPPEPLAAQVQLSSEGWDAPSE